MEVQRGVVGDDSLVPPLAAAVAAGNVLERIAHLCTRARAVDVPVLHCTAESRPDGLGSNHNARLFALARRAGPTPSAGMSGAGMSSAGMSSAGMSSGAGASGVHPSIGVEPADFVLSRLHGLSPMAGTSLDPILRNLGITTIVATGVSVNVALLGLAFDAVNRGYQLVLARDATAGIGDDYVDAVYANTLSLLATITTADAVVDAWSRAPG